MNSKTAVDTAAAQPTSMSRSDALNLLVEHTPYGTEDADRTSCAVSAIVAAFECGRAATPAAQPSALAALTELVSVKDLKDRTEALSFAGPIAGENWREEYDAGRKEYIRRQPLAWEAARAVLAATPVAQPPNFQGPGTEPEFSLAEAKAHAHAAEKMYEGMPSVSRTLLAEIERLEAITGPGCCCAGGCWKERADPVAQPSAEPVTKIDRDESMDRSYIPLPGGWELQTKGKGSTLRLLDKKTGERFPLPLPDFVIEFIERMGREIYAATAAPAGAGEPTEPSAELTTCNCRWKGDKLIQQCTLHEAWRDAIHDWAERAKTAERRLETRAGAGEQPSEAPATAADGWITSADGLSKRLAAPDAAIPSFPNSKTQVLKIAAGMGFTLPSTPTALATPVTAVGGEPSEKRDCDTCKHEGTGNNECRNCYQRINWKARDE